MTDDRETPSAKDDAEEPAKGAAPEPKKRAKSPLDGVMRGLVLIGLGVLVTAPLWCQNPQTQNFQRTTFRADREDPEDQGTEEALATIIEGVIRKAASDQEVEEVEVMRDLSTVLADAHLGSASQRAEKTDALIGNIVARAAEADGRGYGEMQDQAIRGQARLMARNLITELGGVLELDAEGQPEGEWEPMAWPTLRGFEYEEGMDLPAQVTALDGKDVMAWGYLLYLEEDQFLLVESLWSCCFGRPPDIHEAIVVRGDPSLRRMESQGVRVYGRFEASEEREEGHVTSLYRLDAEHVRPM